MIVIVPTIPVVVGGVISSVRIVSSIVAMSIIFGVTVSSDMFYLVFAKTGRQSSVINKNPRPIEPG
jgi:hypothetical protein